MLSEGNLSQDVTNCTMPFTWHYGKGKTLVRKSKSVFAKDWDEGSIELQGSMKECLRVDGTVWNPYCGGYINLYGTHRTCTPSKVYNNNF